MAWVLTLTPNPMWAGTWKDDLRESLSAWGSVCLDQICVSRPEGEIKAVENELLRLWVSFMLGSCVARRNATEKKNGMTRVTGRNVWCVKMYILYRMWRSKLSYSFLTASKRAFWGHCEVAKVNLTHFTHSSKTASAKWARYHLFGVRSAQQCLSAPASVPLFLICGHWRLIWPRWVSRGCVDVKM